MQRLLMTLWLLLFTTAVACSPSPSSATPSLVGSFDAEFRRWNARFMPQWEYPWLRAQCMVESGLKPEAVSPAGAVGLCQFMRPAWSECQQALRHRSPRTDAKASIMCAAWYMSRVGKSFYGMDRTDAEVLPWAQSAYNCGAGCIKRAARKCGSPKHWRDAAECMPRESREYPLKIQAWYYRMTRGAN